MRGRGSRRYRSPFRDGGYRSNYGRDNHSCNSRWKVNRHRDESPRGPASRVTQVIATKGMGNNGDLQVHLYPEVKDEVGAKVLIPIHEECVGEIRMTKALAVDKDHPKVNKIVAVVVEVKLHFRHLSRIAFRVDQGHVVSVEAAAISAKSNGV